MKIKYIESGIIDGDTKKHIEYNCITSRRTTLNKLENDIEKSNKFSGFI